MAPHLRGLVMYVCARARARLQEVYRDMPVEKLVEKVHARAHIRLERWRECESWRVCERSESGRTN